MLGLFQAFSLRCSQIDEAIRLGDDARVSSLDGSIDALIETILGYRATNLFYAHMQMQFVGCLIDQYAEDSEIGARACEATLLHDGAVSGFDGAALADAAAGAHGSRTRVRARGLRAQHRQRQFPELGYPRIAAGSGGGADQGLSLPLRQCRQFRLRQAQAVRDGRAACEGGSRREAVRGLHEGDARRLFRGRNMRSHL